MAHSCLLPPCVYITYKVKEGPLGVSPSPAVCSPIPFLPPDDSSAGPSGWRLSLGLQCERSGVPILCYPRDWLPRPSH